MVIGVLKRSRGRALGTFCKASPDPLLPGAQREVALEGPRAEEAFGRAPESLGRPSAGGRCARTAQGVGVPQAGAGCIHTLSPTPTPARPLVPEELPDTLERLLRARFLSPVRGDSGSPVPKAYPHPLRTSRVLQSRPVTQGDGRRGAGAAWPQSPRGPASRRAPQWRARGLPGLGHARPGAPAPSCLEPRLAAAGRPGAGGGAWGGGGARPAAGVRLLR